MPSIVLRSRIEANCAGGQKFECRLSGKLGSMMPRPRPEALSLRRLLYSCEGTRPERKHPSTYAHDEAFWGAKMEGRGFNSKIAGPRGI